MLSGPLGPARAVELTLTTSAPRSPRMRVANGPARTCVKSRMRNPSRRASVRRSVRGRVVVGLPGSAQGSRLSRGGTQRPRRGAQTIGRARSADVRGHRSGSRSTSRGHRAGGFSATLSTGSTQPLRGAWWACASKNSSSTSRFATPGAQHRHQPTNERSAVSRVPGISDPADPSCASSSTSHTSWLSMDGCGRHHDRAALARA